MHAPVQQRSSSAVARRRGARVDRSIVSASLAVRSRALAVLERDRGSMQQSRALVEQSRVLCSRVEALPFARAGDAAVARGAERCTFPRCHRPSPFQACFFVRSGSRTYLVRDLPLRVCADHRAELDALFQRASVVESLRRKLVARGREAIGGVRVLFEVVA